MSTPHSLTVAETFYSIQGETSFAGYPCVFIRLAGCNLRCSYCDARYTYEEPGSQQTVAELAAFAASYPGIPVMLTGGEPLLQKNTSFLLELLVADGRTVLVETNGSLDIGMAPKPAIRIVDMKCPESGMADMMRLENLALLQQDDEVKFVISSRADFDWAVELCREHDLAARTKVLFSPVSGRISPAVLAEMILAAALPVRLQLQLHTILWPGATRGK